MPNRPWPGKSIATMWKCVQISGASASNVPALSSQPCSASSGGSDSSPQTRAARRICGRSIVDLARRTHAIQPCGVLFDQRAHQGDVRIVVVERGNVFEMLAAARHELFLAADRDFLERFQAIDGEAGTQHLQALHALFGQFAQGDVGVGRQPRFAADARLERQHHFGFRHARGDRAAARPFRGIVRHTDRRGERSAPECRGTKAAVDRRVRSFPRTCGRFARAHRCTRARRDSRRRCATPARDADAPARRARRRTRCRSMSPNIADTAAARRARARRRRPAFRAPRRSTDCRTASPVRRGCRDPRMRAPTFSVSARDCTSSGEPCGVQIVEYACADRFGPDAQDHAVKNRQPQPARVVDDARIAQEFGQIAAHRRGGRGVRRAEVDQQRGRLGGMRRNRACLAVRVLSEPNRL